MPNMLDRLRFLSRASKELLETLLRTYDGLLDAFGRVRVSEPIVIFDSKLSYNNEPLKWGTVTSGLCYTAYDTDRRAVAITSSGLGYAVRQSLEYITYQPGRSQNIYVTGVFGEPIGIKSIGQFDAQNGLFFRQDGSKKQIIRRNNGVDSITEQSDWNLDPLDGTGKSGVTVDWTKDHLFAIDYGWLGTAKVRWGMFLNGKIIYCNEHTFANDLDVSYMQTASLPIRYELQTASGESTELLQICASVASEGGYFEVPGEQHIAIRTSAISTATENVIVAIRPSAALNGISNRTRIRVTRTEVTALSNPVQWRLLYFPPNSNVSVSGGSFAPVNGGAVEANVTATSFTGTGAYVIAGGYINTAGTGNNQRGQGTIDIAFGYPLVNDIAANGNPITSNQGGNPAHILLVAVGASATALGTVIWEEIR